VKNVFFCDDESRHAKCHFVECHIFYCYAVSPFYYGECRLTKCRNVIVLSVLDFVTYFCYAGCHYPKCCILSIAFLLYWLSRFYVTLANCNYADCRRFCIAFFVMLGVAI
jgi:hypothetical protein